MNNQKAVFAIVAIIAAVGLAATVVISNLAYAAISLVNTGLQQFMPYF